MGSTDQLSPARSSASPLADITVALPASTQMFETPEARSPDLASGCSSAPPSYAL